MLCPAESLIEDISMTIARAASLLNTGDNCGETSELPGLVTA
jgi:hypothetical protein